MRLRSVIDKYCRGANGPPSANGTLAVRVRSEIAASAVTIKRGSWCVVGV